MSKPAVANQPQASEKTSGRHRPWAPGESGNPKGRPPGVRNKLTKVRETLLQALEDVGDSTEAGVRGKGGLLGYIRQCAVLERKATLGLLGRMIPQNMIHDMGETLVDVLARANQLEAREAAVEAREAEVIEAPAVERDPQGGGTASSA